MSEITNSTDTLVTAGARPWVDLVVMDFGGALKHLKIGCVARRNAWSEGDYIFLITGRTVDYNTFQSWQNNANQAFDPPHDVKIVDHIDAKVNGRYITGWIPTCEDILAEDWTCSKQM